MPTSDIRHMMRQMRRSPLFAFVTIAIVALGVGATTAVYGLVRGVVLHPLPYGEADRLGVVWEDLVKEGNHTYSVTPATYFDIAHNIPAFEDVAFQQTGGAFTIRDAKGSEHTTEVIRAGMVSGNFFHTIRSSASIGRTLTPEDEAKGSHVVVLSDALWRKRFGADSHIIGSSIILDDVTYVIVGVMPRSFESPWVFKASHLAAALWAPLTGLQQTDRQSAMLQVITRRKPGVAMQTAQTQLDALATSLTRQFPESNKDVGLNLVDMHEQIVGRVKTPLFLILASISFLLLIACANLASLLLQRTVGRQHELAVRLALGATRARIASQLITENVFLATLGGIVGIGIGAFGLRLLVALAPSDTPRLAGVTLDRSVIVFAILATLAVAVALAVAPVLRGVTDVAGVLRAGRMKRRDWTRSILGLAQVALAVLLLVGGTLLLRSFRELASVNPGFDTHNLQTLRVGLPAVKYTDPVRQNDAIESIVAAVERVPGVSSAGMTSRAPLDPPFGYAKVNVLGKPDQSDDQSLAGFRIVTPAYLHTLDVPLLLGRALAATDVPNAPQVAVVNTAFVLKYLGGQTPVGARVSFGAGSTAWVQVIGVAGNMNNGSLDAAAIPEVFVPMAQQPISGGTLIVRTDSDPHLLVHSIQSAIATVDPGIATQEPLTMEEVASGTIAVPRFASFLLSAFAAIALLLALTGVYAIFAQSIASQTRELTIRAALGAPGHRMVLEVLQNGLLVSGAGIGLGCLLARSASKLLASQLFGVTPGDTTTYAVVALLMITVTGVACVVPARRVLRTDPAAALR